MRNPRCLALGVFLWGGGRPTKEKPAAVATGFHYLCTLRGGKMPAFSKLFPYMALDVFTVNVSQALS
jgi:hypothetical protein